MLYSLVKLVCAELVEMRKGPKNNRDFNESLDAAIEALKTIMMFL